MALLRNLDTNQDITRYVNFTEKQEVNRILQTALDGSEYISRYGNPVIHYELTLYLDEDGKKLLMEAEDTVAFLSISVRQGNYLGRIIELSDVDQLIPGWYKVKVIVSPNSEV